MFQVGSACYSSAASAASAIASAQVGSVVQHGGTAFVVDASGVSASSITYVFYPIDGGTAITLVSPITLQECGLLTASDGLQMGWLIAAVWIAAFSVIFLARVVKGGADYGNA